LKIKPYAEKPNLVMIYLEEQFENGET